MPQVSPFAGTGEGMPQPVSLTRRSPQRAASVSLDDGVKKAELVPCGPRDSDQTEDGAPAWISLDSTDSSSGKDDARNERHDRARAIAKARTRMEPRYTSSGNCSGNTSNRSSHTSLMTLLAADADAARLAEPMDTVVEDHEDPKEGRGEGLSHLSPLACPTTISSSLSLYTAIPDQNDAVTSSGNSANQDSHGIVLLDTKPPTHSSRRPRAASLNRSFREGRRMPSSSSQMAASGGSFGSLLGASCFSLEAKKEAALSAIDEMLNDISNTSVTTSEGVKEGSM